jgi:hypothetical protein
VLRRSAYIPWGSRVSVKSPVRSMSAAIFGVPIVNLAPIDVAPVPHTFQGDLAD